MKVHFKRSTIIYMSISVLIVLYLSIVVQQGTVPRIDVWTDPFAASITSDAFYYSIFHFFTFLGSRTFLIPFCLVMSIPLYYLFRTMLPFLVISGGTLMTYGLNSLIKLVVQRKRPQIVPEFHAEGFSFPSGHAMISFVFYCLLIYFLAKHISNRMVRLWIWISGCLLILFVGSSRYILYVHYASDILAGFLIGSIIVITLIKLYEMYTND